MYHVVCLEVTWCVIYYLDEDGMADPKCVEKYKERQEEEEDTGEKGPNGQCMFL